MYKDYLPFQQFVKKKFKSKRLYVKYIELCTFLNKKKIVYNKYRTMNTLILTLNFITFLIVQIINS